MGKPTRRSMIYKQKRELKRLRRIERDGPRYLQRRFRSFYVTTIVSVLLFVAYNIVNEVVIAMKGPVWLNGLPAWLHVVAVAGLISPHLYMARNDWLLMLTCVVFWTTVLTMPESQPVLFGATVLFALYALRRISKLKKQMRLARRNMTKILVETAPKIAKRKAVDLNMRALVAQ